MKLRELRTQTVKYLKNANDDSPEADSGLIIMSVLGIDKTRLLMGETEIPEEKADEIWDFIERCAKGEPVQYITGECEFMSLPFSVGRGVLVPRADTEILVETIMERLGKDAEITVADICCGSGCIGISMAHYMKKILVTAVDISADALEIAELNAKRNNVADRIRFERKDIMKNMLELEVDCIVSNPPYIPTEVIEKLDDKVKCYEPKEALDGGESGLDFYRRIVETSPLKIGGLIAFEIGYDQGNDVSDILKSEGYIDIEVIKDIEGRDRVVVGTATKSRRADMS